MLFRSGTPGGSYFTDIQAAVDASAPGDVVLVSNGVYATGQRITPGYALSNRIVMTKAITLSSVSGPAATIIIGAAGAGGGNGNGALRGVFMTAGRLEGFTSRTDARLRPARNCITRTAAVSG